MDGGMNLSEADIENAFAYHPATPQSTPLHEMVRDQCKGVALNFLELLPASEERQMAVIKLREAMFWANSAISCKLPTNWPGAKGE